jgi:cytochrome P450
MFSHQPSRPHSITKRWISHVYSKSQLFDSPSLGALARIILSRRLMPIIRASAQPDQKPQGINVHELWFATAMDFISAYQFGLANSTNFLEDRAYRQHWLELYLSRKTYTFFPQELPRLTAVCHKLGIRLVPRWVDWANQEIEAWMKGMVDRGIERWSSNSDYSSQPETKPVVLDAILSGMQKEGEKEESLLGTTIRNKPDLMVASELLDHAAAGQETTAITLTYLTWHLSQDLPLQHALRKELLTLDPPLIFPPSSGEDMTLPPARQLDSLPLLHACIMETLRLNAAIPGNTPRVAPFPSAEICGFEVPGGTRVGAAAFTLHRNRGAFDDPLRWDYHRWLDGDRSEEAMKDRDRWFWAFNSGGRMCIGNHFAINGMLHSLL